MSTIEARLAQDIVDRTMRIIPFNVNVMDGRGIILGSGETSRIGELHSGALLALAQNRTVEIDAATSRTLRGVKPGVNIPLTVRGQIYDSRIQAPTVTAQVEPLLAPIKAKLPAGYRIETGGAVEESAKGQDSVNAGIPLFLAVVFTVLMVQLGSFSRTTMVVLTAPLGLIGVVLFLLLFNQPFGFVAMLGTIALFGMIMRNSVILVDQIEQDVERGLSVWDAIVESAVRRLRPIALTAAAAVLAMIPLTRSTFFGPMAVAIMGGLIVATLLTLLFVPALYAAWYRVRRA